MKFMTMARINTDTNWSVILGILIQAEEQGHQYTLTEKLASYRLQWEKNGQTYSRFEAFKGDTLKDRAVNMVNGLLAMHERFADLYGVGSLELEQYNL